MRHGLIWTRFDTVWTWFDLIEHFGESHGDFVQSFIPIDVWRRSDQGQVTNGPIWNQWHLKTQTPFLFQFQSWIHIYHRSVWCYIFRVLRCLDLWLLGIVNCCQLSRWSSTETWATISLLKVASEACSLSIFCRVFHLRFYVGRISKISSCSLRLLAETFILSDLSCLLKHGNVGISSPPIMGESDLITHTLGENGICS